MINNIKKNNKYIKEVNPLKQGLKRLIKAAYATVAPVD